MIRLSQMLTAYEQKFDLSAKSVAASIGVCESTYSRMKSGKLPDAHNLSKLMVWITSKEASE